MKKLGWNWTKNEYPFYIIVILYLLYRLFWSLKFYNNENNEFVKTLLKNDARQLNSTKFQIDELSSVAKYISKDYELLKSLKFNIEKLPSIIDDGILPLFDRIKLLIDQKIEEIQETEEIDLEKWNSFKKEFIEHYHKKSNFTIKKDINGLTFL